MKALHYSCQGESHKAVNKVCQDYSYSESTEQLSLAIVCDGHGGKRYFRSDIGAKYATEITCECVKTFVSEISPELFNEAPLTQVSALNTEITNSNFEKKTGIDKAFRQLFSSIIFRWQERILEHARNNSPTETEISSVESAYIDAFNQQLSLEKTYGCTLMCYVQTKAYWFAFHIGDGKCIAFDINGNWSEPIPWDDRCFLNMTTSLCDSDALSEFRYCYAADGTFPAAIFLGSDGIDDSFGEITNMVNFYAQVVKMLSKDSYDDSMASIEETLPTLSARGSQDDMSVACVYDEHVLPQITSKVIEWQKNTVFDSIVEINRRLEEIKKEGSAYQNLTALSQKEKIQLQYLITELKRLCTSKHALALKYETLSKEIDNEGTKEYTDDTGFCEQVIEDLENVVKVLTETPQEQVESAVEVVLPEEQESERERVPSEIKENTELQESKTDTEQQESGENIEQKESKDIDG